MALGFDEKIDDRSVIEVVIKQFRSHPAAKQLSALFDLLGNLTVEIVVFQAVENFFFIV
jgi:hypothetical protein